MFIPFINNIQKGNYYNEWNLYENGYNPSLLDNKIPW
jgi:hypothetical protein